MKTRLTTTNDSKHSHSGLPGSNEHMSFRLKTVGQQRFKICNRKGKIIGAELWAEQWGVVGKQQLFFRGAGTQKGGYHSNTEDLMGTLALANMVPKMQPDCVWMTTFFAPALTFYFVSSL